MKIVETGQIPIKMWLDDVEEGAMQQANNLTRLPFAYKHIALMPDCHQGYGMPIGGVMATLGAVVPNAVGVDIGCGMCSVETYIEDYSKEQLKKVLGFIRQRIPVGFNKHHVTPDLIHMPEPYDSLTIVNRQYDNACLSLGTLGGGNHFIELQADSKGKLWVMIHSGSRNLGLRVADYYNKVAIAHNAMWHSSVPKKWDLAFLPTCDKSSSEYIHEMAFCVRFALANRQAMMREVLACLNEVFGTFASETSTNIAHNYVRMENHFGKNVMVHRKGATSAQLGEIGIIPGSQGSCSFIVRGLGNPQSFHSCSHGAGRKMGRKAACRELNLKDEQTKLDSHGIIHSVQHNNDLDEAPGAYKNIEEVMLNQEDLVEIVTRLRPLAVVKG